MVAIGSIIAVALPRVPGLVNLDKATANERTLMAMRDAIEGFAIANGRLPCPDTDNDGNENCPVASLGNPSGNVPYRTIGLVSGKDGYNNTVRYSIYVESIGGFIDLTNPNSSPSKTNLCSAVVNAQASSTSYLYTVDADGTSNPANAPFVLVSGGPSDADRDGSDGRFDGNNESATLKFDKETRVVSGSYDDHVVTSSFNRSSVSASTYRSSAFAGFQNRVCSVVPKTGSTTCYNASGTSISCSGTGQDGELQKGVTWPTTRFTNNGNGTVTDNLTGLVWLQDPGTCFSALSNWTTALSSANSLSNNGCSGGLTDGSAAGEWRLPNRFELQSLIDYSRVPVYGSPPTSVPLLPASHPFSNIYTNASYISSSTYTATSYTTYAWGVHFFNAVSSYYDKALTSYRIWPVRNKRGSEVVDNQAIVQRTGQIICYLADGSTTPCTGTNQDGALQKGIGKTTDAARFTNSGDGTVTDNVTGLIWLRNANCFGSTSWSSALSSANTLASGSCNLSDNSVAGNWRLPNTVELNSLMNLSYASPALTSGHPFTNVQSGGSDYYWVSSTFAYTPSDAWRLKFDSGIVDYGGKSGSSFVWPVRGGKSN
ncbi:MAG: DUF1566 domain-containing protein [Magnetococcales bacterium]|nr:DUF1566 domain-containing protein [Magnetococcales bacterium]